MPACVHRRLGALGLATLALALGGCSRPGEESTSRQPAGRVTAERLAAAAKEPGEWFTSGRDAEGTYHSPLTAIHSGNVGRLGFAWEYALNSRYGLEATPIVVDGVMYFSGNWGRVYALDAASGQELWTFDPQVDGQVGRDTCCDFVNRGVAVWDGKVYVIAQDGRLFALDAGTGRPVWSVDTIEHVPGYHYTSSGAPQLAGEVVVVGNSGADLGARGYVTAYDLKTGTQRWRVYTVPKDPRLGPQETPALERALATWDVDGDWSKGGGGTVWDGMAYDAELNLVYVGTGNGAVYNARRRSPRGGDNLYLSSILALDAKTGDLKWHFQTVPSDHWDYTATMKFILADLSIGGRVRQVIMQAPKNGYFYVLDRATGELISAQNYVYVNWTRGLEPQTGRPIPNPRVADYTGGVRLVYPSMAGAHNWFPMAFNPATGLVYVPVLEAGMVFIDTQDRPVESVDGYWSTYAVPPEYYDREGMKASFGELPPLDELVRIAGGPNPPASSYALLAWDPVRQRAAWKRSRPGFWNLGGATSTAGNLVLMGGADGFLEAYAADSGKLLHRLEIGTSIMAAPMTYSIGGRQYVAVLAGYGGGGGFFFPPDSAAYKYGNQGRVVVLTLDGGPVPKPPLLPPEGPVPEPAAAPGTPSQVARGDVLYNRHCGRCHVFGRGLHTDLRRSQAVANLSQFQAVLLDGALRPVGMGNYSDVLTPADVDALRAYLLEQARLAHASAVP